jgi:hypothetical protein
LNRIRLELPPCHKGQVDFEGTYVLNGGAMPFFWLAGLVFGGRSPRSEEIFGAKNILRPDFFFLRKLDNGHSLQDKSEKSFASGKKMLDTQRHYFCNTIKAIY